MNSKKPTKNQKVIKLLTNTAELALVFVFYNFFQIYTENKLLTLKKAYRFSTYDENNLTQLFGIAISIILILEWLRRNSEIGKKYTGFYNYLYIFLIIILFILGGWSINSMAI